MELLQDHVEWPVFKLAVPNLLVVSSELAGPPPPAGTAVNDESWPLL